MQEVHSDIKGGVKVYAVIDSTTYKNEGGSLLRACSILADSVEDLPTDKAELDALAINFGSWAWCVAEGEQRVLNSEGVWTP